MRVYVPSTTTELATLRDSGAIPGPRAATAVTADLKEWYTDTDTDTYTDTDTDLDELEYAALLEAARLSLRMVDADPSALRRRVVIAADVADSSVEADPGSGRGSVRLLGELSLREVVSLQVDGPDAEPSIAAATAVVIEADLGSDDAQFVVDTAEAYELDWYATQELGPLLELL